VHAVDIPEPGDVQPAVRFMATVNGDEQVVMGTIDGAVIAVAKLAHEESTCVLRGVQISEDFRGKGIGARLLRAVATRAPSTSYVIAYQHLERFYAREGWLRVTEGIPTFLAERCAKYRSKGDDLFVARRVTASQP
jgi:N-acetylglutamate synthase-like GNAT family acetyltransferase